MDSLIHQLAIKCYVVLWKTCYLLLSVRKVIDSCVCERLSDEQIQTASLLQECIMVRDGLACLPEVFTAGDMSDIVRYLCMC